MHAASPSLAEAAGDVRTALVAVTVARGNLTLLASMWATLSRPAWWTGESRWTPPPDDPAARAHALQANLTEEGRGTIGAILMASRERYLAEQRAAAEARMRSFLPPTGPEGNASR